jgi:hypothetical protein
MNIGPPFIAHAQPPEVIEPGQGALDHPTVATEALTAVDPLAGDTHADVAVPQRLATARDVVGLVGVGFVGALAAAAVGLLDGRDGIEQLLKDHRVVAIGAGQELGQREAGPLDHNMALRARFAAVRWVGPDEIAPLLAGMLALSNETRLQSIRSASPRRSSNVRCNASQTPASCQSRTRRQQVMPEPQPSSCGNISHGMPDLSTKTMPVKQSRSGTRGRPPLGLGGSDGSSGATIAHSSSLTSGLAMSQVCHVPHRF